MLIALLPGDGIGPEVIAEAVRVLDVLALPGLVFKEALVGGAAYTADGHSGTVFMRTLDRLGLLEAMKPKLRPAVGRTASSLVTSGEAQMWAGPISTPSPGTQIVGRFPEEIQTYVGISAAISAGAKTPDIAQTFIKFLASPEAQFVFEAKGFQQIPVRR